MDEEPIKKVKFSEKFSLKIRKTMIVSKLMTCLMVLVFIAIFIGLNMWIQTLDLPAIDVTANKVYTLSDASKEALKSIDQETKIYVFGIDEKDSVVELIKQYCAANEKITYEMLSKETNLAKVQEFELEDGYSIVVVESGESKKIIDASSQFHSYDYNTMAEIDITEQTLTNSILGLSTTNKPKIYFLTGHGEFGIAEQEGQTQAELGVLSTYLRNEAFEIASINLTTAGTVPEDCDVLAIVSPTSDFLENETQAVINYINKGGNLFLTQDVVRLKQDLQLPNLQKILDLYGVSFEKGYAIEIDENSAASNYPYIFRPQISSSNSITSDIGSDSYMLLAYAEKLKFAPSETLQALKVTYEELLGTTDTALFITNLSANAKEAAQTSETGKCTIAALVTKTISEAESEAIESKLVISGTGTFCADYVISEISTQYPLSYIGSNKDFAINSIATLASKDTGLKIRKDIAGTSYVFSASESQNRIVLAVIFSVPIIIILIGIVIWKQRKKRK